MANQFGTTYLFAQHGPISAILRRATALSVVIGTVLMLAICIAGVLPLLFLPLGVVVLGATAVTTYYFGSMQFKRGFVVVTPSEFVIKGWFSRQSVSWENVASVTSMSFKAENAFGRRLLQLVYGGQAGVPFVRIALQRSRVGRMPGILKVAAAYRWGVAGMLKVQTLYLEEPEKFIEEAQQFISLTSPPAMSMWRARRLN